MRHLSQLVFDEVIAGTGTVAFTSAELNAKLGQFDALTFHGVTDLSTATGSITLQINHSGDGRNWVCKNNPAGSSSDVVIPIAANAIGQITKTDQSWSTNQLMTFVQLQLTLSGTTTSAHLKLYVCARDQGGR